MFKRRRGFFKGVVLYMLKSKPLSGYEILKELAKLTGGRFTPSPGSLYPLLSYLEAEGLVEAREVYVGRRRKKVYALTQAGEAYLKELEENPEFVQLLQELERGPGGADFLAAIRDELAYIEEVFDEVEGGSADTLREIYEILRRLEAKVLQKLSKSR